MRDEGVEWFAPSLATFWRRRHPSKLTLSAIIEQTELRAISGQLMILPYRFRSNVLQPEKITRNKGSYWLWSRNENVFPFVNDRWKQCWWSPIRCYWSIRTHLRAPLCVLICTCPSNWVAKDAKTINKREHANRILFGLGDNGQNTKRKQRANKARMEEKQW